jgi:hypothetical protein
MADDKKPEKLVIPLRPIKSSMLRAIGYDAATGTLAVEFNNGGVYHHPGVPADVAAALAQAESPGRYYGANIRSKFKGGKP